MTAMWVCYTSSGREFDAQEEADAMGLWTSVPRRVDMIRRGNNRRPDPVTSAYLPNYLFVTATPQQWHWLKQSKWVRSIMGVSLTHEANVRRFIDRVERDYAARMTEIEDAQRVMDRADASKAERRAALAKVQQYQPGDLLEIIAGPFAGTLASFARIASAGDMPEVVAEAHIFGRAVEFRIDPLGAKPART